MQHNAVHIRVAVENDVPSIYRLVLELAQFEKALDQVENTLEQLKKDGFGPNPLYGCLVAETDTNAIVGLSLYYFRYSTWKGKRLFLEDLIVSEEVRNQGIGKILFEATIIKSLELGCNGMVWQALDWNTPAVDFYKKYGSEIDTEWLNITLDKQKITSIVSKISNQAQIKS